MRNSLSTTEKLWLTATEPEAREVNGGLTALALLCAGLAYLTSGVIQLVAVGLLLAALAGVIFVLRVGLRTFDVAQAHRVRTRAQHWANAGDTEQDCRSRHEALASFGPVGALSAAGLSSDDLPQIMFNIDGTPMLPGGMLDLNGHSYGQTDVDEMMFEVPSVDMNIPEDAYHGPIGGDNGSDPLSF